MMGTIGELARRVLAAAGAGAAGGVDPAYGSAREQLAHELFDWHGGPASGLYAVGEAWLRGADAPPGEVDRALSELQRLLDDEVPSPGERRHVAGLKARLEAERGAAKTAGAMKRALEALSEEMGHGGAINDEVVAEGRRRLDGGLPPFGTAPATAHGALGVKCPKCGEPVWDKAGADQRLNKCWGCGWRFDACGGLVRRTARTKIRNGGGTVSRYHAAERRTGVNINEEKWIRQHSDPDEATRPGTPATGTGRSVEETATGCVGADSYKDFARRNGYGHLEVLNWTSSAGDWQFIVSKDGQRWRVLQQENNHPRGPGFSHTLGDEEYEGTAEEVLGMLEQGY